MVEIKYLTNNDCYKNYYKIKPQYIIVHSTAYGYRNKDHLFNGWNKPGKLSVHGMVDDTGSYLSLPLDCLGWHVGAKGNEKTIGFEICEPRNIKYANKNNTKVDTAFYNASDPAIVTDFEKRYKNAVELAVYMVKQTGIPVDHIVSHKEGHSMGIASNHGDPDQWWVVFGKTMDDFRADVKKAIEDSNKPPVTNPNTGAITEEPKKLWYVQCGAFAIKSNAIAYSKKLTEAGFPNIIKKDGLIYRVQTGAFANRQNAVSLYQKIRVAGFAVILKQK